ncbi:hypothetical protein [Parasaccharibacter sp. TMW2.1890]|uniref:capsular polysaccharide export protein, LipB/KpsS family n=1 Tax=Parasaccharibacter sp. TMW2.1890 TaxID=2039289 RepID=UPI0020133057|nr:hypothetical protein [Parasaccharibacter sp. TMW2.1890]MCL1514878.1 hypothetical protein [Parasaccharibacter sp. TMW2.1890]
MSCHVPASGARAIRPVVACHGIAWWKQRRIRSFLEGRDPIRFFWSPRRALAYARKKSAGLAVWANRITPALQAQAYAMRVPLFFVEDGFIRSMGLGSGFLPPCSIILDSQGAYVDPSHPSDLEDMLRDIKVAPALRGRADTLMERLKTLHVSKYAATPDSSPAKMEHPEGVPVILVPGQVAGDLSVVRGGGKITDNLALLREVRRRNPGAWIIYRPHPDVEAGHRSGHLSEATILAYANSIDRSGSMSQLLTHVDEVHTLTSLTGFEALIRGKKVTTYGAPFYAGWGLTTHLGPSLPRRGRQLDVTDLAAIALILYPLYINPETEQRCDVEELIDCFGKTELWKPTYAMKLRQRQGQLRRCFTHFISSCRAPHA